MTFPLAQAESHEQLALAENMMDHVDGEAVGTHAVVAVAAAVVAEDVGPEQRGTNGDVTGAGAGAAGHD